MNLEQVREMMRKHEGAIKAWALCWSSIETVVEELGVRGTKRMPDPYSDGGFGAVVNNITIFGIPVVLVPPDGPEGVIV